MVYRRAAFYSVVEEAVQNCVQEAPSVVAVPTKLFDAPSFNVPVAIFVKHEVERNSIDKTKMKERFVKLAEDVVEKKIQIEDRIPTKGNDLVRSPSPPTDVAKDKKPTRRRTVQQRLRTSQNKAVNAHVFRQEEALVSTIDVITTPTPQSHKRTTSESGLKVLVAMYSK